MKINFYRVLAFLLLIPISLGFGFAFDAVATVVEKHNYPREASVAPVIEQAAERYGVPEYVLWATVKVSSNFVSNAVSGDGKIGLMQLHPDTFHHICTEVRGGTALESGMLYDPTTNLQAGAEWLAVLYDHYGIWETAYAAYFVGTDQVDAWLGDPVLLSSQGTLIRFPDKDTQEFVDRVMHASALYERLYYNTEK